MIIVSDKFPVKQTKSAEIEVENEVRSAYQVDSPPSWATRIDTISETKMK